MDSELAHTLAVREQVLTRLRGAVIRQLGLAQTPEELDPDAPLFGSGLGLDSLDAVEVMVCVEGEFAVQLPDGAMSAANMRTLNCLVNMILDAGGGQ